MNAWTAEALSQAIYSSLIHGSFIFFTYKIGAYMLRNHTQWQYRLAVCALVLMPADFILNLSAAISSRAVETNGPVQGGQEWTLFGLVQGWFIAQAEILGYAYLTGFCLCSLWMLGGYARLQSIHRDEYTMPDAGWQKQVAFLSAKIGLRRKIELRLSRKHAVPCTFGFFRPVIVLPVAMLASLTYEQAEAILLHELAHIRRNDYLVNVGQGLIENLLFFNPFAWLISADIRLIRELCCDDEVIRFGKEPLIYAQALARVADCSSGVNPVALNANGPKTGTLFHRIARITDMKKTSITPHIKLLVVLMMITAIAAVSFKPEKTKGSRNAQSARRNSVNQNSIGKTTKHRRAKGENKVPPPPPPLPASKKTSSKKTGKQSMKKMEEIEIVEPAGRATTKGAIPPPPPPVQPDEQISVGSKQNKTQKKVDWIAVPTKAGNNSDMPPPPPTQPVEKTLTKSNGKQSTKKNDELQLIEPVESQDKNGNIPPPPPPTEPKRSKSTGSSKQTAGKIKFPPPAKERNGTHQETKKGTVKFPPPIVTLDKTSPKKS